MMKRATGEPPTMWGSSIVGFGRYRYRYASGREGEWPLVGFSPLGPAARPEAGATRGVGRQRAEPASSHGTSSGVTDR